MTNDWKPTAIGAAVEMSTIAGILIRLARCNAEGSVTLTRPPSIGWAGVSRSCTRPWRRR